VAAHTLHSNLTKFGFIGTFLYDPVSN